MASSCFIPVCLFTDQARSSVISSMWFRGQECSLSRYITLHHAVTGWRLRSLRDVDIFANAITTLTDRTHRRNPIPKARSSWTRLDLLTILGTVLRFLHVWVQSSVQDHCFDSANGYGSYLDTMLRWLLVQQMIVVPTVVFKIDLSCSLIMVNAVIGYMCSIPDSIYQAILAWHRYLGHMFNLDVSEDFDVVRDIPWGSRSRLAHDRTDTNVLKFRRFIRDRYREPILRTDSNHTSSFRLIFGRALHDCSTLIGLKRSRTLVISTNSRLKQALSFKARSLVSHVAWSEITITRLYTYLVRQFYGQSTQRKNEFVLVVKNWNSQRQF